ncbi:MAG TPA: hypothetical protein VOA41_06975 [Candidatus Dormibacteraeota bacterium]|nr:hypothetical protein [Candidatus Dormibacteraeota bacterium]
MAVNPYSLEIEAPDLGADVKVVALELIETINREPVRGPDAARIWAAAVEAIAATEPWVLDFFSHLDRVREFCHLKGIACREAAERHCVIPQPDTEQLVEIFQRFEAETFGMRAGGLLEPGGMGADTELEIDLSHRGVDAYHPAFPRYFFCAVTDFENGFLTLLSNPLSANEVTRRVKPAVATLQVSVALPQ